MSEQTVDRVFLFMFTSGYQVIAKVLSEDTQTFIVDSPLTLIFNSGSGSTAIYTQRLMPLVKTPIVILNKQTIMTMGEVSEDVEKYYYKMVERFEKSKTGFITEGLDDPKEDKELTEEDVDLITAMVEKGDKTIH